VAYWVDIEQSGTGAGATAIQVQLADRELFLLLESSEPTGGRNLINAALGALVSQIAGSAEIAPHRALIMACQSANRVVCEKKMKNPVTQQLLISVTAVLVDGEQLHFTSVGANTIYQRARGRTLRLNDPENEARQLVHEGITADPVPSGLDSGSKPTTGLGLPPEVFEVRQSGTLPVTNDQALVICGGRTAVHIGKSHIATTSPLGGESSTARRLLQQAGFPKESAVLAAHKTLEVVTARNGNLMPIEDDAYPEEGYGLLKWVVLGLVVAGLVFGVWWFMQTPSAPKFEKATPPAPTTLLPAKDQEGSKRSDGGL
jgi:hypothetical protein